MVISDSREVTPAVALLPLHHGTDNISATDILNNGLSLARAVQCGGTSEFWATTKALDAETFAQVNPAGGTPARYSFDFPSQVLQALLVSNPPRAYQHGADWDEFLPVSFPQLNLHMVNQVVSPVP